MLGLGGEVLVVGSQCQSGSIQHRFPRSSSGVTLSCGKSCENYVQTRVCQLETVWDRHRNFIGPQMELGIVKYNHSIPKAGKDLQDYWAWPPKSLSPTAKKLHRTFRGNSQNFHREFLQTFQAFSTAAKAGISPQWAPTQHHKHTQGLVAFPAHEGNESLLLLWLWAAAPGSGYGAWKGRMGAQGKEWRQGKIIESTSALVMLHISNVISINKLSVRRCSC